MSSNRKRKVVLSAVVGTLVISANAITVSAAEDTENVRGIPVAKIESILKESFQTDVKNNLNLYFVEDENGSYRNLAFSNATDYTYVREEATEDSEWVGKLYQNSTVEVLEYVGEWTRIRSGAVEGYVPSESLWTGDDAKEHEEEYKQYQIKVKADVLNVREGQDVNSKVLAQIREGQIYNVSNKEEAAWYQLEINGTTGWVRADYVEFMVTYIYAETKEEEEARLAEEERLAALKAKQKAGQAVVDFACQFIGNPYVWGGTSLTNGADCSGFVQAVFANFGISLPRTTWGMESVGTAVSYSEAMPGDLILYSGHVGIYMGNGQIINAQTEATGIGVTPAGYAPIITVRRVL
jgi:cell wall-associated NlpC family hydrolase